jgi:hypothetical protein
VTSETLLRRQLEIFVYWSDVGVHSSPTTRFSPSNPSFFTLHTHTHTHTHTSYQTKTPHKHSYDQRTNAIQWAPSLDAPFNPTVTSPVPSGTASTTSPNVPKEPQSMPLTWIITWKNGICHGIRMKRMVVGESMIVHSIHWSRDGWGGRARCHV